MAKRAADLDPRMAMIQELMEKYGLDREAAALVAAVELGDAMVDDVEFDPPLSREELYRRGITMPIEERIALARRQVQARDEGE
jgi:hypothetical protein